MNLDLLPKDSVTIDLSAFLVEWGFTPTGKGFYQNDKGVILARKENFYDIKKFVGDGYNSEYVFRGFINTPRQMRTVLTLIQVI